MQCRGEILCENGTKPVIALKYIMRLQPLYTRTLWKHPINNKVIKKKKKNRCRVLLGHKPQHQYTFCLLQPRITSPSCKAAVRGKLGPSAFSSFTCLLGTDVRGEWGVGGAYCIPFILPSEPGVLAGCMTQPQLSSTLFFFFFCFSWTTSISASYWLSGKLVILPMQIDACFKAAACWRWGRIFTLLREMTTGEDAFQT